MHLTDSDVAALRRIDTPTICNLVEMAVPVRRNHGFTFKHLHCAFPAMAPIVGCAKTLTMRARLPGPRSAEQANAFREAYIDYVASGGEPKICIVQDLDEQPGYGSLWGEVFTSVHKALGVSGVVTNGSVRDLDMIPADFQLLAGLVAPSRANVHMCDFGGEVNVHGMTVHDGDLVHADRHGAVVIPREVVPEIPRLLELIGRKERLVLDASRAAGCTPETLKAAMRDAGKITA